MSFRKWDIVQLKFPFSDGSAIKTRPAVVLGVVINDERGDDLIVCAITSQMGIAPCVEIPRIHPEFQQTGLKSDSRILPGKIFTYHKKGVLCKHGELGQDLISQTKTVLRDILKI